MGATADATQLQLRSARARDACTPECKPTFEYGVEDNESAVEPGADGYRRAGRVSSSIASMPSPGDVAALLEALP
jgi:hypothetical protein